eukprot:TRINITY_DN49132_c0_g1_i1.p1 TRINITY_DN49132_c0_g1~~TRINITY_DN49132_c0_g1_i1.p1  ORF type:complete len:569 (+),score=82.65 TRINITY_DN49132_c0_g1_i1:136-1842(+)
MVQASWSITPSHVALMGEMMVTKENAFDLAEMANDQARAILMDSDGWKVVNSNDGDVEIKPVGGTFEASSICITRARRSIHAPADSLFQMLTSPVGYAMLDPGADPHEFTKHLERFEGWRPKIPGARLEVANAFLRKLGDGQDREYVVLNSCDPVERIFTSTSVLHQSRPGGSRFQQEAPLTGPQSVRALNTLAVLCETINSNTCRISVLNWADLATHNPKLEEKMLQKWYAKMWKAVVSTVPVAADPCRVMSPFVEAKLVFVKAAWRGKSITKPVENEQPPKSLYHALPTRIYNGRFWASRLSLLSHGFQLIQHKFDSSCNWKDDVDIRSNYFPAMLKLAIEVTGALEVLPIYHMVRDGGDGKYQRHGSHYTTFVHGDISPAIEWAGGCPKSGVDEPWSVTAGRHFAIVNFWRSIGSAPVQNHHLTVLDPSSLEAQDIVPKEDVDAKDKSEHVRLVQNDLQRWLYFPLMARHEVLAFTQYDTRSSFHPTFHSAFVDPSCPPGAPARESIELRILCIFGPDSDAERRRQRVCKQFPLPSDMFQQAPVPFVYHAQLAQNVAAMGNTSRL